MRLEIQDSHFQKHTAGEHAAIRPRSSSVTPVVCAAASKSAEYKCRIDNNVAPSAASFNLNFTVLFFLI